MIQWIKLNLVYNHICTVIEVNEEDDLFSLYLYKDLFWTLLHVICYRLCCKELPVQP